jgi:diguanylate cyclase (GGDEF)-like protein
LMSKFDDFVINKFQGDPFLVVSYSTEDTEGNPVVGKVGQNFRTLWNKRLYGVNYKKDEVAEVLDLCDRNEFEKGSKPFVEIFHNGSYYYFMSLGTYDNSQYLSLFKIDKDRKNDYMSKIISHLSRLVQNSYYQLLMAKEKEDLKVLIHNDDVTGLYNQRKLHLDLDYLIEQFENQGHPFSIVFIDIDHFKSVNDGHGHLVGSQLLVEVADILRACLRDADLIYRYGGDEFVVIIPETAIDEATQVGGRILKEIKGHRFRPSSKDDLNLSVSVGIAEFPGDAKTKEEVLQIADDMMYKAKKSGRGRVVSTRELLANVKTEKKEEPVKPKIVNGD